MIWKLPLNLDLNLHEKNCNRLYDTTFSHVSNWRGIFHFFLSLSHHLDKAAANLNFSLSLSFEARPLILHLKRFRVRIELAAAQSGGVSRYAEPRYHGTWFFILNGSRRTRTVGSDTGRMKRHSALEGVGS